MHQQFQLSSTTTLFYRYNPQADVLAVRLQPDFKPADERPLPDQPAVSLSHDSESGDLLGLRISGVQQLLLQSLIREVVATALPQLLDEAVAAPAPVVAPPERSPIAVAEPIAAVEPVAPVPPVALAEPVDSVAPVPSAASVPSVTPVLSVQPPTQHNLAEPTPAAEAAADGDTDLGTAEDADAPTDTPEAAEDRARRRRRRRRRRPEGRAGAAVDSEAGTAPDLGILDADAVAADAAWSDASGLDDDDETDFLVALPEGSGMDRRRRRRRRGRRGAGQGADQAPALAGEGQIDAAAGPEPRADRAEHPDLDRHPADRAADRYPADRTEDRYPADRAMDRHPADRAEDRHPVDRAAAFDAGRVRSEEPADLPVLPGDPVAEAHWDDEGRPCPEAFAPLGLHPRVTHAIHDLGFSSPTPIQEASIPVTLTGEDLIGLAQTGTGKTLAFVAPALSRMLDSQRPGHRPRMLILAPTRELAVQVALEAERLAAHTDLRVATVYGGVSMGAQTEALRRGVDLVVATPGRILDHLRRRNVSLESVETLVLDEADRMLDMGFLPDVRAIIRQLPSSRQTLLFTATFPPEIESLSLEFQRQPRTVEIARRKPPESIDQRLYPVGKHLKAPLLVHLLENDPSMDRVLVFTERKVDADVLARKLRQDGVSVALMHGDRTQVEREQALAALKSRKVRVLVATNVAARGLDIEDISHVVNYDIPQSIDEYVHRIGRTARAANEGKAYSLVTLGDEAMITRIESALGRQLPRVQTPGFNYDVPPPAWAKPSASDVLAWLNKETSTADRLRVLSRRRR